MTPRIVSAEVAVDRADEALRDAIEAMQLEYRTEVASARAAEADARRRADRLAQLLTAAAHIATAYLDNANQPDLRDEAQRLLDAIRQL